MIFLSVTGSFAAAITYDRQQKKAAQRKWCDLVAHLAQEPLAPNMMPRKLTIFLAAPPGDGMRPSREYFKQYVKPVLVAAAMDYDVIEGRKEGDVRYGTAEQIRRFRRKKGEKGTSEVEEPPDTEKSIDFVRERMGIQSVPGLRGDIVIGRHTWKEYIRGLHEGWLGPLDEPLPPLPELPSVSLTGEAEPSPIHPAVEPISPLTPDTPDSDDASPSTSEAEPQPEIPKPVEEEKKPPSPPYAYLTTAAYSTSALSPIIPQLLEPSSPIPQPHLLGFLKTPIRMYRYLNQRYLADDIGRQTAAIVLAASRPYQQIESFASTSLNEPELDAVPVATRAPESDSAAVVQTSQNWEQQSVLVEEEPTWHKSVRKARTDDVERVWLNDVVMDPRIAERMSLFILDSEEEARAQRIGQGTEKGRAIPQEDLTTVKPVVDQP